MKKDFKKANINFLNRWKNKNILEIKKINDYLNEFGTICMEGHIDYRNNLIKRNLWIDQEIKELTNEI